MEYYAQIDDNNTVVNIVRGNPSGRFHPSIQWLPCNKDTQYGDIYDPVTKVFNTPKLTLAEMKNELLKDVSDIADSMMSMLIGGYPEYEVQTWSYQLEEAKALLADPNAEALLLRNIAKMRHVDVYTLATRTLGHNAVFKKLAGRIIGKRQYFEDVIGACNDVRRLSIIKLEVVGWKEAGVTL